MVEGSGNDLAILMSLKLTTDRTQLIYTSSNSKVGRPDITPTYLGSFIGHHDEKFRCLTTL